MKANELMIGDWVEPHQCMIPTVYCKVEGIYPDGTVNLDKAERLFTLDELEPIPLTPEILEKNDWEEKSIGYVFYTDGKRYDNSLWYIFGSNTFVVHTAEFQIKYVHDLQHALRLCGIEKEIEL